MRQLLNHIKEQRTLHKLWNKGDVVVLGVSGGKDSICLFDLFLRLHKSHDIILVVAHVNHGLRGKESLRDQKHVESLCLGAGIECETLVVEVDNRGENEAQWRETRYAFFKETAIKHSSTKVATAHHKNDQAESLLLHLIRGSGQDGLRGMLHRESRDGFELLRPLLLISQEEILSHCKQFKLRYFNDRTNSDNTFLRNRIRNRLIPYLEKNFNPNIVQTLSQTAEIHSKIDINSKNYETFWATHPGNEATLTFPRADFLALSTSDQRLSLREMCKLVTGLHTAPSFGFIEEIRKAILSKKNRSQIITGNGLIIRCKNDIVELALS